MIGFLTTEESLSVLAENVFGRIGCNDGFNTYVYPSNYVFDGKYILCHSLLGSKILVMRANKRICLLVDVLRDNNNWKSVMVLGTYEELTDERSRYTAMKVFNDRLLHLKINEHSLSHETSSAFTKWNYPGSERPVFYRILIDEVTGRFEKQPA
jgi:hypothetical protein